MGIYLNPENGRFDEVINSKIYVDKTGLIEYTNSVMHTSQKYLCVSRPRRFGKSITASMLMAYYSKGCDSHAQFKNYEIAGKGDYEKQCVYIPNNEVRNEYYNSVSSSDWGELR